MLKMNIFYTCMNIQSDIDNYCDFVKIENFFLK